MLENENDFDPNPTQKRSSTEPHENFHFSSIISSHGHMDAALIAKADDDDENPAALLAIAESGVDLLAVGLAGSADNPKTTLLISNHYGVEGK